MDKELTYTDEQGTKMYGFSQTSLDQNTKWIKILVVGMIAISLLFFFAGVYIWNYIIDHNVANNVVAAMRSC